MSVELDKLRRVALPGNCAEFPVEDIILLLGEVDSLTRELAGWSAHCANLESDVERAHELVRSYIAAHDERTEELAERTRERDEALARIHGRPVRSGPDASECPEENV